MLYTLDYSPEPVAISAPELCYVMSCHVMSCHVMSCHVMSCRAVPCRVVSCRGVSWRVMLICYVLLSRFFFHPLSFMPFYYLKETITRTEYLMS